MSTPLGLDGNELRALCQLKWHRQAEEGEERRKEEREKEKEKERKSWTAKAPLSVRMRPATNWVSGKLCSLSTALRLSVRGTRPNSAADTKTCWRNTNTHGREKKQLRNERDREGWASPNHQTH